MAEVFCEWFHGVAEKMRGEGLDGKSGDPSTSLRVGCGNEGLTEQGTKGARGGYTILSHMDAPSITIDLGESLPYLEQRFLRMFGQDQISREEAEWFKSLQKTAMVQSSQVHCVGAYRPIPFERVYQPTRLTYKKSSALNAEIFAFENRLSRAILAERIFEERAISVDDFIASQDDAIIYAGPGWGKTTFLHHVFRLFLGNEKTLPVLITLRRESAVEDLRRFVDTASRVQRKQHKSQTVLLVDGYDELKTVHRRSVSESLLKYQSLGIGNFLLTCRDYYPVYDVAATEVRIDRFTKDDRYRFVAAFLANFASTLDPVKVVDELESRGLSDLLAHPLLLSLACILKTGASTLQARSVTRLLERALELLCYQWDEKKGVDRESCTPLDGKDRLKVLRRIAYIAKSGHLSRLTAETQAQKQLSLLTLDKLDPKKVLTEIAQFYGILVPTDDGWEFVHRTLHDFLAAQHWVESGEFAKTRNFEWNSRTAYAASLMEDATEIIEAALKAPDGLPTVAEILSNLASFDKLRVKRAIFAYLSSAESGYHVFQLDSTRVAGMLGSDFLRLSNTRFLDYLVESCASSRSGLGDVVVGYCLLEMRLRGVKLDFQTYQGALAGYGSHSFVFQIVGAGNVSLGQLNPAPLPRLLQT